jgi:dethiobiotin synthetase
MTAYFIAGTDTDVGKTTVTGLMLQQAQLAGLQVAGLKPVASGAGDTPLGRRHNDAMQLMAASNVSLPYVQVNPVALSLPASPHIAAAQEGQTLTVANLSKSMQLPTADMVLLEGAGGWLCPISTEETLADWVIQENWPVILVVGMRLGCLNHAMLTVQAMQHRGVTLTGWVANALTQRMPHYTENVQLLRERISAPLLAEVDEQTQWHATPAWRHFIAAHRS